MRATDSVDTAPSISELFVQEEMRSERYANYARIFFTFLYLGVGLSIQNQLPQNSFDFLLAGTAINFLYALIVLFITRNGHHHAWLKYVSTTLDVVVLSVFIHAIGTFRTFKTEAYLLYFVWIGLATIRFSPRLTLLTGLSSLLAYLIIIFLALADQTIELGTITESFMTPKVSLANVILQMIFLGMFTAIAVYISKVYHTLVAKAIEKVLVEKQNLELSRTLRTLKKTQEELHNTNRELRYISATDSLSSLYNRRKIEELLYTSCDRAAKYNEFFSLILLDIDLFKRINDEYGHPVGDIVIKQIAENLKNNVRDEDAVGRWGGEEFLIICPGLDAQNALKLAERLRQDIQVYYGNHSKIATCSFGVTMWRENDTAATIINRVDKALYQSKNAGRNCATLL